MTLFDVERVCRVEGLPGLAVLPPPPNLAAFPGAVAFIHPPFGDFRLIVEGFIAVRFVFATGRGSRLKPDGEEPLVDWLRKVRCRIVERYNLTGEVLGFGPVG